ncbi:S49 family peptidase [Pectobacterium brasiliense]|uniref:S49 family peptidase n=1 Tax=Pectobacterium brasiliense TaxID=180957 RepID=UPI000B96764C|nr:S49 family peptidase [Pectobacterium carotovorum]OYN52641.1 serine peptidase [Pectobacterium carotovorum]
MQKLINYPHLASEVFGIPLFATQRTLDAVKSVLVPRLQGITTGSDILAFNAEPQPDPAVDTETGIVAVIPVHGLLVSRRGQITGACSELTSFERIRSQLSAALNDKSVSEVVLDINSGGGHVAGCKELADYIFASRDIKPITAIVNYNAFSAAYFIAAACSRVVVSQTSGVGSIGVIMELMEASKLEADIGLKFTTIYRGDFKNAGSQHTELTEPARAEFERLVDDAYAMFTTSVAQYRGIDVQAVIDTQARLFYGQDAVDIGLADELSDPQSAINAIAAKYAPETPRQSSIQLRAAAMQQQMKM